MGLIANSPIRTFLNIYVGFGTRYACPVLRRQHCLWIKASQDGPADDDTAGQATAAVAESFSAALVSVDVAGTCLATVLPVASVAASFSHLSTAGRGT